MMLYGDGGVHLGGEAKKLEKNKPSGFESKTLRLQRFNPEVNMNPPISTRYPPFVGKSR